jgi:hypothetical protein
MSYLPYTIVFQDAEGSEDMMYLCKPQVGDVIKTGILDPDEHLEYFVVEKVVGDLVFVVKS